MKRYTHIIWDWNGTLFDDAWLCLETMNKILAKRSMPAVTAAQYEALFGFPVIDYYRKVGFDFIDEPFEQISTEFIQGYERRRAECQLRPDGLQALRQSQQSGAILSILSASKQAHLDEVVHDFGIRDLFERVMGIDNHHAAGKLDIGLRWMAEVRAVPEETVLIGDTLHDYEVAQSMGIDCCLIPSGHQNLARLAASGSQVAESITALFDTLMLTG